MTICNVTTKKPSAYISEIKRVQKEKGKKACPAADKISVSWSCIQLQAPCSEKEGYD